MKGFILSKTTWILILNLWEEFIKSNQKYVNIIKEKDFDTHINQCIKL